MNKELSVCFYGALSLTKVTCLTPEVWQVMRGVDPLNAAAYLLILLKIFCQNSFEKSRSVLG